MDISVPANWWAEWSQKASVRLAIQRALAKHFCLVALAAMQTSKNPDAMTWSRLGDGIGLTTEDQLRKKKSGRTAFTFANLLAAAALLEISPQTLLPKETGHWLESTTSYLTKRPASPPVLRTFVARCLSIFQQKGHRGDLVPQTTAPEVTQAEAELNELIREIANLK